MLERQDQHILELRIHGIANTPPEVMLGVPRDEIISVGSDELGGFWRYRTRPEPAADTHSTFEPKRPLRTDDDPRILTEAYSWGNMVRSGGSFGAKIMSVIVQIGWLLTLPFALCNAAYWTRRIVRKTSGKRDWLTGPGAGTVRLFALGLTLLLTSALATVALDLIGTQCFRDGNVCARLPEVLQLLPRQDAERPIRLAILSLAVLAVMLLLFWITHKTRVRYEANVRNWARSLSTHERAGKGDSDLDRPLLATSGFWSSTQVGQTSESLHLAAVLALLAGLLAWDHLFSGAVACHDLKGFFPGGGCSFRATAGASWLEAGVLGVSAAVLVVVVVLTTITTARSVAWIAAGRIVGRSLAAVAVVAYVAYLVNATWDYLNGDVGPAAPEVQEFLGLTLVPTVLVALLAVGCISALWWRLSRLGGWLGLVPLVGMLLIGYGGFTDQSEMADWGLGIPSAWAWTGLIIIGVHAMAAVVVTFSRSRARFEAWRGFAAAVTLTLSLTAALLLTCLLVFGVRAALMPTSDPSTTEHFWRIFSSSELSAARQTLPNALDIPLVYDMFGLALLIVFGLFVVVIGLALVVQSLGGHRSLSTPDLDWPDGTPEEVRERGGVRLPGVVTPGCVVAYPLRIETPRDPIDRQISAARRFAAFAHRGEPLAGVLALLSLTAIMAVVGLSLALYNGSVASTWESMFGISLPVMVAVALGAIALVVVNVASSKERALGLLWDILSFFPRAGHPLAPPCYAERVIPELSYRTLEWLRGGGPDSDRRDVEDGDVEDRDSDGTASRKVVLSAHSMGGVIATAMIFAVLECAGHRPNGERSWPHGNIGLLTYGVQLRAFFSRIFPDVLGPDVLGVPPTLAPQLFAKDPWQRQVRREHSESRDDIASYRARYAPSLSEELAHPSTGVPAWVSLWRRTDFLGFPVASYNGEGNQIDRGATETDPDSYLWQVARHSRYQFTLQYETALHEVIGRLSDNSRDR